MQYSFVASPHDVHRKVVNEENQSTIKSSNEELITVQFIDYI